MASYHLSNHLRKYRKRSALSQRDVAYLLGDQGSAKVCRHERFFHEPGLQAALAYEAIFNCPVSELFPGLYEKTQKQVRARAKQLEQKEFRGNARGFVTRKRQALAAIGTVESKNNLKHK
jgi:DNA-binding XRE family transcriptional regulator